MPDYEVLDDYELADLLRSDDEIAFNEIYLRFWDKLYILARKRLGNAEESEEIVQDIFYNLWRKRHDFTLQRGFNNYFSVAVKFEVINRLSKLERASTYQKEMAAVNTEIDESTIHKLDLNELIQQLQLNINALPEKCRIVFKLQYEQGYTQRQIAKALDISEKTVEAHLSKARKNFRGSFGNLFVLLVLINWG